jgi:hypothetical protein
MATIREENVVLYYIRDGEALLTSVRGQQDHLRTDFEKISRLAEEIISDKTFPQGKKTVQADGHRPRETFPGDFYFSKIAQD